MRIKQIRLELACSMRTARVAGSRCRLIYVCNDGRLRVRDINDAIRELGQMVAVHTGTASSTFTKLTVLQEAVQVITDLENRLRGTGFAPYTVGTCMQAYAR